MSNDIKNILDSKNRDELNIIAKKLRIKKIRSLNIPDLISAILKCNESQVRKSLSITWWDRYHNHVYGFFTIAGFLLAVITTAIYPIIPSLISESNELHNIVLKGEVRDADTNELITDRQVFITIVNHDLNVYSDSKGEFSCLVNCFIPDVITIIATHSEYNSQTKIQPIDSEKALWIDIKMTKRAN